MRAYPKAYPVQADLKRDPLNMRAYPVRADIRAALSNYGSAADTINDALWIAYNMASAAYERGKRPKVKFPRSGASLWLNPALVTEVRFLAEECVGHRLSTEQAIRVILALAAIQ